jgi:hypothetical protein
MCAEHDQFGIEANSTSDPGTQSPGIPFNRVLSLPDFRRDG